MMKRPFKSGVSYVLFTLILAIYFSLVVNIPIYADLYAIFNNIDAVKIGFVLSIPIFFGATLNFLFNLFSWPVIAKPFFIILLILSSIVSYAGYNYGTLFDYNMITNIVETDSGEAGSYLSSYSVLWVVLMGIIPALIVFMIPIGIKQSPAKMLSMKLVSMALSLVVIAVIAALYYQDYSSVGRNNRYLKKAIIPTQFVYSTTDYIWKTFLSVPLEYRQIGLDAKQTDSTLAASKKKPTLMVLVVGETARSQNYELNGYPRDTNEYTRDLGIISFKNVSSCGTATAVSVPCMFSSMTKNEFNRDVADNQDNLLDILKRANIALLWKENDGGDKNVAARIDKVTIERSNKNEFCDGTTCYDMALLDNLEQDIDSLEGNRMIILHIMGSHGPTYYKRYPAEMTKFKPDCPRSDIENCSIEEIVNTYDNTILYTDYVVSNVISKLEKLEDKYNTSLIYISDHGESLGENGMFLHGMPYSFAPDYQTKVPLMVWMSEGFKETRNINRECIKKEADNNQYSHDNIFHSILGVMEVETSDYKNSLDIFSSCKGQNS
ncbi:phosphoethanolamine--lipid A transferase [Shewanella schlegeliana]|uniref:Phosphoethanolamine--lipid A transferase n=1 Tax=Shewanella schlegeliana TaxID=190308 RepID=A0ABS1SZJ8_9GAMM|nr:phosphoethanolamine--lipid A transferase [Shewanella schlegeliana]